MKYTSNEKVHWQWLKTKSIKYITGPLKTIHMEEKKNPDTIETFF